MPFLLFLVSLIFGAGAAGLGNPLGNQLIQPTLIAKAPCYQVESGVTVTVDNGSLTSDDCRDRIDSKTYVRVRQKVKIVNSKISEGVGSTGNCIAGSSRLRKIGATTDGREVWWLDKNHLNDDTSDFIFVFLEKEKSSYVFDIYIDDAEKDKLASDPKYEFVRNCKETGGIVPVLEGPATPTFPPQAITLMLDCSQYSDPKPCNYNKRANQIFDNSDYQTNYDEYKADFLEKYFMRIQEQTKPAPAEQVGILRKTINGETRTYEAWFHAGIVYLVGKVGESGDHAGKSWMYNPTDEEPPLGVGWHNPALQLGQIKFITVSDWTWATPECKPAIYLYPQNPTELSVKVKPEGRITVSDPEHGEDGWKVIAYPDGSLTRSDLVGGPTSMDSIIYPYLYYETELTKVKVPQEGWIVAKEELPGFFGSILPELGLNKKEMQDFLDYWVPKLEEYLDPIPPHRESALPTPGVSSGLNKTFLFVGLIDREELDRIEPIEFSTTPDTFIRVRFYFEKIDEGNSKFEYLNSKQILNSKLQFSKQFGIWNLRNWDLFRISDLGFSASQRDGFTAVDWGGIIANGSCGVGEKSQ
ncbi:hypothetical protein FJY90_02105 [Candidatus Gottesmanbacteria bacterium]|nr:hypothetical protein [Candidatus Gottesmanbacteria bacterium]